MSVNSNTSVYGTNNPEHYAAVVDVDVNAANPNDPTNLGSKAKALVFISGGSLDPSGKFVPGAALAGNADTAALITLAAQAAGTVVSADQVNNSARGVQVGVNLTVATTVTVTVKIQGKDAASGQYYDILTSVGIVAAGFTNLTVYPGAAATVNVSSPQPLPHIWRVSVGIVGASAAVTGTVGASTIA